MLTPSPLFVGKCDVSYFISCNPRRIMEAHVDNLAAEMEKSLKDIQYPVFVCVPSAESYAAEAILKKKEPYACKIIVCYQTNVHIWLII